MLLDTAIDRFLDAYIAEGRSMATVKIYRSCLRSFRRFTGNCDLSEIDEVLLREYLKHARLRSQKHDSNPYRPTINAPLSRESIRTYYRHIRAFIRWCHAEGLLARDPTERVKMPPPPKHAPKDIDDQDFWKMVKVASESGKMPERDKALILLLGDTGARAGGIVGLTIDRVNLDYQVVEMIEKGEKSRIIPISLVTVDALREWLSVRPDIADEPNVFLSYQGHALTVFGLYQAVKRIADRAEVTGRSNPHAFRHFFGRKWIESGGDISPLSDMLGHSQIHITKQFYLRYNVETMRKEHRQHSPLAGWEDES